MTLKIKPVLGIIGVGLIGGSVGLAQKKTGAFSRVLGVGRSSVNMDEALRLGAIDEAVNLSE